jgi:hypothetical protein
MKTRLFVLKLYLVTTIARLGEIFRDFSPYFFIFEAWFRIAHYKRA